MTIATDAPVTTPAADPVATPAAATSTPAAEAKPTGTTIATASDTKPAEGAAKPADAKAGEKPAEVKYDLKLPDGSKLPAEHAAKVAEFAKEHKIAPELAQKLLERDNAQLQAQIEQLQAKSKEWAASVEADKDLGGQNFSRTKEDARRAIVKFDPKGELARELDATGYGNHPAFVRFVAAIGRAMAEDTVHSGSETPSGDALAKLYPTMSQ